MTSADQVNSGTRRMFMPGARVVSTVVASDTDARPARPSNNTMWPTRNRSTKLGVAAAGTAVGGDRR